jgi:hypothetical protein
LSLFKLLRFWLLLFLLFTLQQFFLWFFLKLISIVWLNLIIQKQSWIFFFSLKPAIVVTLAWYVNVLSLGDFFKQRWIIFSLFFSWLCFVYFLYLSFNFFLFFKKGTGFVEKSQSMFSIFHILIFQKFWFFFLMILFFFFSNALSRC